MPTVFILSLQGTLPLSEWQGKEASTPEFCLHVEAAVTIAFIYLVIYLFINRPDDKETYMLSAKLR